MCKLQNVLSNVKIGKCENVQIEEPDKLIIASDFLMS